MENLLLLDDLTEQQRNLLMMETAHSTVKAVGVTPKHAESELPKLRQSLQAKGLHTGFAWHDGEDLYVQVSKEELIKN